MRISSFVGISLVSLLALFGGSTPSRARERLLEFSVLLQKLINVPGGQLEWSVVSGQRDQVQWVNDGLQSCPPAVLRQFNQPFCRTGYVILGIDGTPTHRVLRRKLEPGRWKITLIGFRVGATHAIISSDVNSQELDSDLLRRIAKRGDITLTELAKAGGETDRSRTYEATVNQHAASIVETYSCGSGGCSLELDISGFHSSASSTETSSPKLTEAYIGRWFVENVSECRRSVGNSSELVEYSVNQVVGSEIRCDVRRRIPQGKKTELILRCSGEGEMSTRRETVEVVDGRLLVTYQVGGRSMRDTYARCPK